MPGQIEDESILGNKEKTKTYWESRLRNGDSHEDKDKFNGLNKTRHRSSNTSPIIQKINAEIEELHRREKELKNTTKSTQPLGSGSGSVNGDDDDVFSSNGSSVDEFEHSESPRLESGFYSNLGEDETQEAHFLGSADLPKGVDPETEAKDTVKTRRLPTSRNPIEKEVTVTNSTSLESLKVSEGGLVKVRSDVNARTFIFKNETPIEKEIRSAREREEEHRLERLGSVSDFESIPATPKTSIVVDKNVPSPVSSVTAKSQGEEKRFGGFAFQKESNRNMQYQMATDRLRREMLEAKEREDELRTVHRTMSTSTLSKASETEVETKENLLITTKTVEKVTSVAPPPPTESIVKNVQTAETKVEVKPPGFIEIPRKSSSTSSEIPATPSPTFRSIAYGKSGINSFNSIQRYLLKGSKVQLRIVNNIRLPPPVTQEEEKIEEPIKIKEDEEEVEPETPRRKLIPATHKIQNELREMKERENELALVRTRIFKSTPNLAVLSDDGDDDEVKVKVKEVTISSDVTSFAAKDRKRSNLIHQWEGIMHSGN